MLHLLITVLKVLQTRPLSVGVRLFSVLTLSNHSTQFPGLALVLPIDPNVECTLEDSERLPLFPLTVLCIRLQSASDRRRSTLGALNLDKCSFTTRAW